MSDRKKFWRVCQCCLSTKSSALSSISDYKNILEILIGQKLKKTQKYLCYNCRHILKKFSKFRDKCLKSNKLILNYHSMNAKNKRKNRFLKENENSCNELSLSNTLCINVKMDTPQSSVNIVSFNRGSKPITNNSENINEIRTEHDIKMESDLNHEFKSHEFEHNSKKECRSNHASNFSEDLNDDYSDAMEVPEEKFEPCYDVQILKKEIEMPIDIDSSEFKIDKQEPNTMNGLHDSFFENNSSYEAKNPFSNYELKSDDLHEETKTCRPKKVCSALEKKNDIRKSEKFQTPQEILDEVDRACSMRLTQEQQIKKLQDKAKESLYIDANYRCELCILPFYTRLAMENHMKKHDESSGHFVCPICTQRFPEDTKLSAHQVTHSLNLVCKLCNKEYTNKRSYQYHLVWHSTGNLTCNVCEKNFKNIKNLRSHVKSEHGPGGCEKHKCETCGREFNKKSIYNVHILRHTGVPTHTCAICSKGFYSLKSLSVHQNVHKTMPGNYYCVECDRRFKSSTALVYHLKQSKSHRDPNSVNYKCPQCPLRFATANLRTQHINAQHEGITYYVCETCGARYLTRTGLIRHIKTKHEGFKAPRKYPCTLCENAFASKVVLENHIRVHTGERPFQCMQCQGTFTQEATLRTHIKLVHRKIKPNKQSLTSKHS